MFKSKSFNLINEDEQKKSKTTNKYGWMRYFLCPAIIGFMLLLILVNVDFSRESLKEEITTGTGTEGWHSTFRTESDVTKDMTTSSPKGSPEFLTEPTRGQKFFSSDICSESSNPCIVTCSINKNEKELNTRLEAQQAKCDPYDFQLTIKASTYSGNTLGKTFLSGNFRIETLFLNEGILYGIDNNAFKKSSLKGLKILSIEGFTLEKLNQQSFTGLESITHFKMSNKEVLKQLDARDFLKPMADTLIEMTFCQSLAFNSYDPTSWLSGNDLKALTHVDLSGNKFPDTLNEKTFERLVSVESLILKSCGINSFKENTFSLIVYTLKYLDLSQNYLKTLSTDFLLSVSLRNVNISLSSNQWNCDCNNNDFVETIQRNEIIFVKEPKCSTPNEWYNEEIKKVKNYCNGNSPTTIVTTVEVQTTETDIITETPTTEAEVTTTLNATSTTDIMETTTTTEIPNTSYTTDPVSTSIPESSEEIKYTSLECKSTMNFTASLVPIRDKSVYFILRTISVNKISIELEDLYQDIHLIYFVARNTDGAIMLPITNSTTLIEDLFSNEDYIFCALPLKIEDFSPYNCQSYHTGLLYISQEKKDWLNINDMPLFISLSVMGAMIFLLIGFGIAYFVLRWRPTLLKGSKRLLKLSNDSKQVFLCKHQNELSIEMLYEALRTYSPLYSSTMDNLDNNDYLQFYVDKDASHTVYAGINFHENLPPDQRAPALPPIQRERPYSVQSTIPADESVSLPPIDEIKEEHEYQSLDQYQQIYELHSS